MLNLFKRNKEPLNTVDHCGGNRGVVPERGHATPSAAVEKQPKVRIEFDDIANPTVWIDGKKVTALESMDMHWMTRIKKKGEYRFEISYFDSKNPASLPVKWGQSNMQPTHSGKVGNIQCKLSIDGTQLAKAFKDFEESLKVKSVTGNHGYSADELGVYARQVGDAFVNSQIEPDTKAEKEVKLLADIMFIKGEIEKVADVSRDVKFEEKHLKSDLGYLTKFLQTLGVNCYESETIIYGQTEPYTNIKGLVVLFGDDRA